MKKWEIYALVAIVLFGAFLRLSFLSAPPLWVDEATSIIVANNIHETGLPMLDSGNSYSVYFLHYVMSFFMLFSDSEAGARFASVLFGLATIILAFVIGKEYSKSGGILAALFTAIFYLEVFYSRQARYYQLFQLAFFLSLYLLYKSKEKQWLIYPALVAMFIAIDTHLEGLLLCFFFIGHIIIYNKPRWLAIIPAIPLVNRFIQSLHLTSGSITTTVNYASAYLQYTRQMLLIIILFIPGLIWSYNKQKRLTILLIVPSIITLLGIFTLQTFAFRYAYFIVLPLLIFAALLLAHIYDKYENWMLPAFVILIVFSSNLFVPYSYVTMLKPTTAQLEDSSAPYTDYKSLPEELKADMRETTLISYYSPDVQYYIKKPNYVIPFSLNGIGEDQVSTNTSTGIVDRYSGAPILTNLPAKPYYLTADDFSTNKLKPNQRIFFEQLVNGCEIAANEYNFKIYKCFS